MSLPRCRSTIPVANTVERIGLARANAVSSTPTAATPSMRSGCSISAAAVLDDGGHHRSPAHAEIPGHRRYRMPITTDPTTRLLTSPLSPRRPRSDLWMAFGPGLLLTLEVGATPNTLDPHQPHRPIPGRQIPHPSGPPVRATALAPRTPGTNPSRPSFRSRTRPRRHSPRPPTRPCLPARASPWHYCSQSPGAFQFVFRNTTNHEAPGPFPSSGNQPCHPTTTTLHHEEPKILRVETRTLQILTTTRGIGFPYQTGRPDHPRTRRHGHRQTRRRGRLCHLQPAVRASPASENSHLAAPALGY